MWKVIRISTLVVAVAVVAVVGDCSWRVHRYDSTLAAVKVGDTEPQVIARLGSPSFREPAGVPYLRYTGSACAAPCAERLWWELPIAPGVEAWSVELTSERKVLRTYHWVSP